MSLLTRFLNVFRQTSLEREFDDEVDFHLERRVEYYLQSGLQRFEAERQARQEFGDIARAKHGMQEVRVMKPWVAIVAVVAICAGMVGTWIVLGGRDQSAPAQFYQISDEGITPPSAVHKKNPNYPKAAMDAKIQGSIDLKCIVQTTGVCDYVQVAKSLDPTWLDREALKAIQEWRFAPGTRLGQPVPVMVNVEFRFTLR